MMTRYALLLFALVAIGCQDARQDAASTPSPNEPIIRVRILSAADDLTVTGPGRFAIATSAPDTEPTRFDAPLTVHRRADRWHISAAPHAQFVGRILLIEPVGEALIQIQDRRYPGAIRLIADGDDSAASRFHVINHVPVDAYVAGVVQKELYRNWSLAAYHAQAIAARSYAVARHQQRADTRLWDVEATQQSQAYQGRATRRIAQRAAQDTAGLVLTYRDRIIPAMYSSACGGVSLSAGAAFGGPDVPGHLSLHHGECCADSDDWRWGPIQRNRATLSRRIAAWGHARRDPTAAKLGRIQSITVVDRNPHKRPTRFSITDALGQQLTLPADQFRIACNFSDKTRQIPALPRRLRLRSSHVEVAVIDGHVAFTDGRGRGHGVGMCQFGAQHMAGAGSHAIDILKQYYPTASVERAY